MKFVKVDLGLNDAAYARLERIYAKEHGDKPNADPDGFHVFLSLAASKALEDRVNAKDQLRNFARNCPGPLA